MTRVTFECPACNGVYRVGTECGGAVALHCRCRCGQMVRVPVRRVVLMAGKSNAGWTVERRAA